MKNSLTNFLKAVVAAVLLAICPAACGGLMDKPVGEPLTAAQVHGLCKKDPDFLMTYRAVEKMSSELASTSQQARWYDLTYGRLHKFCRLIADYNFQQTIRKRAEEGWEREYGTVGEAVDSIGCLWKEFLAANDPSAYVDIKLKEIKKEYEKEYEKELSGLDSLPAKIEFIFEITPLKGPMTGLQACYDICATGTEPFYEYLETTGKNRIRVDREFTSVITQASRPALDAGMMQFLQAGPGDTLSAGYDLHFRVLYVQVDSSRITSRSVESLVPEPFRRLWAVESELENNAGKLSFELLREKKALREELTGEIASSVLNRPYRTHEDLYGEYYREACRQVDSLAARFYFTD